MDPDTVHPLDLPDSRTVQLNSAGNLIITHSSLSRLAMVESLLYMGSAKSWLTPLAQFSIMNPEKCRRLVSTYFLYSYFILLLFSL